LKYPRLDLHGLCLGVIPIGRLQRDNLQVFDASAGFDHLNQPRVGKHSTWGENRGRCREVCMVFGFFFWAMGIFDMRAEEVWVSPIFD
jgi:hypothetical protein